MDNSQTVTAADPLHSIATTLRVVLLFASIALGLWLLSDILLLVFAGVLLAVLLRGAAALLSRAVRLPAGVALALVTLLAAGLAAGFLFFIGRRLAHEGHQLADSLGGFIQQLRGSFGNTFWGKAAQHLLSAGNAPGLSVAPRVLGASFGSVGALVLLLVMALYLAAAPRPYINGGVRLVPPAHRDRARDIIGQIGHTLRFWMLGQLVSMVTVGVLSTSGLFVLHVPQPVALGVLAGLLTFIPYLGAILAAAPAVVVASAGGLLTMLWVVVLYVGCHIVEGYIVTPLVTRRTVDLPPAITLLSISVFGALFGLPGVLVATPLAATLIVLVREIYVKDVLHDQSA